MDAAGDVQFLRPDGRPLPEAPPAPAWTGPALQPTDADLAAAGIEIDADTATPSWRGERLERETRPRLRDAGAVAAPPRADRGMSRVGHGRDQVHPPALDVDTATPSWRGERLDLDFANAGAVAAPPRAE